MKKYARLFNLMREITHRAALTLSLIHVHYIYVWTIPTIFPRLLPRKHSDVRLEILKIHEIKNFVILLNTRLTHLDPLADGVDPQKPADKRGHVLVERGFLLRRVEHTSYLDEFIGEGLY